MADHQHHDPVPAHHLGRAVGRVVAGGDPDLAGPAVRDRPVGALPRRRADARSTAWSASIVGFIGVVIVTEPRADRARIVAHRRARPARRGRSATPCGAVYSRGATSAACAPMIPAVFQVTFAAIITGVDRAPVRAPMDRDAGRRGDLLDPVARDPRLGPRLPAGLPAVRRTGARRAPRSSPTCIPVVGIVLGYLVLQEPIDARLIVGTALVIAGRRRSSTAGSGGGGCSDGCAAEAEAA